MIIISRKYLLDRWCIRCNRNKPTPYIDRSFKYFKDTILDIGCGNGRNSRFLIDEGYNVISFDMVDDYPYAIKLILGHDIFPLENNSIKTVLANYVFMFLSKEELDFTISEIKRVMDKEGVLIAELYPAKDSYYPSEESILELQRYIINEFDWVILRNSKCRFTLKNI